MAPPKKADPKSPMTLWLRRSTIDRLKARGGPKAVAAAIETKYGKALPKGEK